MTTETVVIRKDLPTYAYLIVTSGPRRGLILQIQPETTSIGRAQDCDLRLDDPTVSTHHARVRRNANNGFTLIDLGGANPTRVNGRRTQQHQLKPNDRIQIGETTLVFKQAG